MWIIWKSIWGPNPDVNPTYIKDVNIYVLYSSSLFLTERIWVLVASNRDDRKEMLRWRHSQNDSLKAFCVYKRLLIMKLVKQSENKQISEEV